MASLQQMLELSGSLSNAEKMAREFIENQGPAYLLDLQLILAVQGRFDEALEVNEKALRINPNDIRAKFDRGWHYMRDRDLKTGFGLMNEGRMIEVWGNRHIGTNKPIWDKGKLGHLLYCCEAGIGDQIVFIRFVKKLIENDIKITVACSPELMSLFAKQDYIHSVIDLKYAHAVYHDYWIPSMAAPVILETTYDDLDGSGYINVNEDMKQKYAGLMGNEFKVGIKWRGNPKFEHEQFRKFPSDLMFKAVSNVDGKVFSLQKDLEEGEIVPPFITDMSQFLTSWEETAAIINNLDLVITSCTGLAHLSAAMGKPTWIVVPILPYWSWALTGDISPWYFSVQLFRQVDFESWEKPFDDIARKLRGYHAS
jgi:tetratricopeptide (TPR) repeat protein